MGKSIDRKIFTMNPEPKILIKYLLKNFPRGNYFSAYEAGYCGFSEQEELEKLRVIAIVVNPADIPTMVKRDEQRRTKSFVEK